MSYQARVLADSISVVGKRLITLEVTMPRIILAEFNTHRVFSRNSASSRAIPVSKQVERVSNDPFVPDDWGENRSGMQADDNLPDEAAVEAEAEWRLAITDALRHADKLRRLNVHKQLANRVLEPFMWHTVIVSATEWSNFFALRLNRQAQPEIRHTAEAMKSAIDASVPEIVRYGEWHLPLIQPDERQWARENPKLAVKVSAGRAARVSYLTHDGHRDIEKDLTLYEQLVRDHHMSPLEHVAAPLVLADEECGNFRGWKQLRKMIPGEADFGSESS